MLLARFTCHNRPSYHPARVASHAYNFLSERTFITGALPTSRTISHCRTQNTFNYIQHNKTHQKCTVFTPTGLFQRRWKTLCGCDSAAAAPASELWKRKPGRRKGPVALRNAAREFWKKRRPMRDVGIVVDWLCALIRCWGEVSSRDRR